MKTRPEAHEEVWGHFDNTMREMDKTMRAMDKMFDAKEFSTSSNVNEQTDFVRLNWTNRWRLIRLAFSTAKWIKM